MKKAHTRKVPLLLFLITLTVALFQVTQSPLSLSKAQAASQDKQLAQADTAPTLITPTLFCLGNTCPTLAVTATTAVTPTTNTTPGASPTVNTNPTTASTAPTVDPCNADASVNEAASNKKKKKHKKHKGNNKGVIKLVIKSFFKFLEKYIKIYGNPNPGGPTPTPSGNPTVAPTEDPSASPSATPTESPCPEPTEETTPEPTNEPTPAPTAATPSLAVTTATTVNPTANTTLTPTTSGSASPTPTTEPCNADASLNVAEHNKKKKKHKKHKKHKNNNKGGFIEQIFKLIFRLFELFFKNIGGPTPGGPTPTPTTEPPVTPTESPCPEPTSETTPNPTQGQGPTNEPTTGISLVPTTQTTPATNNASLPAQVLDLKNWKMTLPIGEAGKPTEIKQPELETYKHDTYFLVSNGSVRFRSPVNGVTTSGSSYPRSELREMSNNGSTNAAWTTSSGTHTMTIDQAITAVPSTKKHVVAGQIHDASDDVIVIRLEMPKLFIDIGGTDGPTLDANYTLGKRFTVKFEVKDGKTNIYYNGSTTPAHTLTKSYSGAYFKAGAYTQSNCTTDPGDCSGNNYGEVLIYNLQVTHN